MTSNNAPNITIVTPSFNQLHYLIGAIENVRSQRGVRIQHIIIDGGSTDGTLDFLNSLSNAYTWISEPDRGQSHAVNKGFEIADAEILGWLNCDDRLTPGALALVTTLFAERADLRFLYGDALGVDATGRSFGIRSHVRQCDLNFLVNDGDPIVQPAAFWTRELWEEAGRLDEGLVYAFDYEFWMRAAKITTLQYLPVCLAVEALHGETKTSNGSIARMSEIEAVARQHGAPGLPRGFVAEAAALKTIEALASAPRKGGRHLIDQLINVGSMRPSAWRYLAHLSAQSLPGSETHPRLRLIANRVRSRRETCWPTQFSEIPQ